MFAAMNDTSHNVRIMADFEKYTVAFIFNSSMSKVLLVHKEKPEWQLGKLNGIGGKYEEGESGAQCIARETREESTLEIPEDKWLRIGTISQDRGNVGVYTAIYDGELSNAVKGHYEEVEWFEVNALPQNVIPNLRWLIPMAIEKLTYTDTFQHFVAEY